MIVAIDGPAASGKSSLAARIAKEMGFFNLNSGAFYRAIAVAVIDCNMENAPEEKIIRIAEQSKLEIIDNCLHLNNENVENRLRSDQVDHWSSVLSSIVPIRHVVNRELRRVGTKTSLVAEGRDMTSVVFPNAEVKIYLKASTHVRAQRRFKQGTSKMNLHEIEQSIHERDLRDSNKLEGSLLITEDSIVLDTSILTLDEVYERVAKLIKTYL